MPAQRAGRSVHQIDVAAAAQRRQRIGARARPLERVAMRIDLAREVPGLARDAVHVLDPVVVGRELVVVDGPVRQRAARGDRARPVAAQRLAVRAEVPRREPHASAAGVVLRPAERVHGQAGEARLACDLVGRLAHGRALRPRLARHQPPAHVGTELVRCELLDAVAASGLESHDVRAGERELRRGQASHGAEPDDDDIRLAHASSAGAGLELPERRDGRAVEGHDMVDPLLGRRGRQVHARVPHQPPADQIAVAPVDRVAEEPVDAVVQHDDRRTGGRAPRSRRSVASRSTAESAEKSRPKRVRARASIASRPSS